MRARWFKYVLKFDRPRGTSRGWFTDKPSWYLILHDESTGKTGIGECGCLPGLSIDDRPGYESVLSEVCRALESAVALPDLETWPSIRFGLEMGLAHLHSGNPAKIYGEEFSADPDGIEINGLVWMGNWLEMKNQVDAKIQDGYTCIKLKIGAIDFEEELRLIREIRSRYFASDLQIRVDANGAFRATDALSKMDRLAKLGIHSIEQPIQAGQWAILATLCRQTPLPIALDEELIGLSTAEKRSELLETVKPQALVLKPSLLGGFHACDDWLTLASNHGCMWWITSALESNVALNAIAQYTFAKHPTLPQGLGTGALYTNNVLSPLTISNHKIRYDQNASWKFPIEFEPL